MIVIKEMNLFLFSLNKKINIISEMKIKYAIMEIVDFLLLDLVMI